MTRTLQYFYWWYLLTAFGLALFTRSDTPEAFVSVVQQMPELAIYFNIRLLKEGTVTYSSRK